MPGVEAADGGRYVRSVRLAHGAGVIGLAGPVWMEDAGSRAEAEAAVARLVGSDEGAAAAAEHLRRDPALEPLVARQPGLRVPGTVDGGELALRAVLGQQVSLAAARTLAGRLVAAAGDPLAAPAGGLSPGAAGDPPVPATGGLTHLWPRPEAVAEAAGSMPMPRSRQAALAALAGALAAGDLRLEPGADGAEARERLLELPGIGPWTADYVALRALADPDAWLPTDLGVRHALARLGAGPEAAERWRPFRAYAVAHLWASLAA